MVAAYSNVIGDVAEEIQALGIPVFPDVSQVPFVPDIIHGQHHLDTITALLHFPGVTAVYFCHGFVPWEESPPIHPRIISYVAVDEPTCRSCVDKFGIPEEKIRIVLNFVDLARFKPRGPLPLAPKRALIFSNQASEENYISVVRDACRNSSIELDVRGLASGAPVVSPEALLGEYDIVFAKARCALEALAVGTAVVLCDEVGIGSMVSSDSLDNLRKKNFGRTTLDMPFSVEIVQEQIRRYNPDDAIKVKNTIRSVAGLEQTLPSIVSLYREAIKRMSIAITDPWEESLALATYVGVLSDDIKQILRENQELNYLRKSFAAKAQELDCLRKRFAIQAQELDCLRKRFAIQAQELDCLRKRFAIQAQELDCLRKRFAFKFREHVLRTPVLRSLARELARIGRKIV